MNHRTDGIFETMRRSRPGGFAAIALILFQVVLSTDHLGAVAARASGMAASDAALGLLALCGGRETSPLDATGPQGFPADRANDCVLCSLAAIASNGVAPTAPVVDDLPLAARATPPAAVVAEAILDRRPALRHGTLRGPPPAVSFV